MKTGMILLFVESVMIRKVRFRALMLFTVSVRVVMKMRKRVRLSVQAVMSYRRVL